MTCLLQESVGAAVLLLLFLGVIGGVELLTRQGRLAAETARKSVHLLGGLGCLLFPFLISSWITVLTLAIAFALTLYMGEKRKLLRSLSSVERPSRGSLFFPMAVLILFVVSGPRIWLYVSALLVLVLADTAAALAGTRLGRVVYRTAPGEQKSLEGGVAFCLVGFFAVYLPLLMLSDIPHLSCFLTALLMAFVLAGLEAVSIGGTDNLIVPVATSFLLLKLPTKPPPELLFQCVSLAGIAILVTKANRRHQTLHTRLVILFILATYAAWSLGSADWMFPFVAGFMIYNRLCKTCAPLPSDLTALELLRPLYPALITLFVANATLALHFGFAPFVVAAATATSLCVANRFRADPEPRRLSGSVLLGAALLPSALPLLLSTPIQGMAVLRPLPVVLLLCAVITLLYNRFCRVPVTPFAWNYAIPLVATMAALGYAGLQYAGVVTVMQPSTWMEVFRCH